MFNKSPFWKSKFNNEKKAIFNKALIALRKNNDLNEKKDSEELFTSLDTVIETLTQYSQYFKENCTDLFNKLDKEIAEYDDPSLSSEMRAVKYSALQKSVTELLNEYDRVADTEIQTEEAKDKNAPNPSGPTSDDYGKVAAGGGVALLGGLAMIAVATTLLTGPVGLGVLLAGCFIAAIGGVTFVVAGGMGQAQGMIEDKKEREKNAAEAQKSQEPTVDKAQTVTQALPPAGQKYDNKTPGVSAVDKINTASGVGIGGPGGGKK